MIRTPQEFVNEVRARFSERLDDEIKEHGRTVIHFAEENNRFRDERDRLTILVGRLVDNLERYHLVGERDRALLREARAALKRKGDRR